MDLSRWLLRASRWSRNPPSAGRVRLVLGVVAVALAIAGVQWAGWWPDWATLEPQPGRPRLR